MKKMLQLSAVSLAAVLAVGCASNDKQYEETNTRLTASESSTARAQARADEAYRLAQEAMAAAQRAQQAAEEANQRAMRMLERASRK